jgi:hypothetical protein
MRLVPIISLALLAGCASTEPEGTTFEQVRAEILAEQARGIAACEGEYGPRSEPAREECRQGFRNVANWNLVQADLLEQPPEVRELRLLDAHASILRICVERYADATERERCRLEAATRVALMRQQIVQIEQLAAEQAARSMRRRQAIGAALIGASAGLTSYSQSYRPPPAPTFTYCRANPSTNSAYCF